MKRFSHIYQMALTIYLPILVLYSYLPVKIFKERMLNVIIISLQSVNEWPVFNLKKHIDKHSKLTASKDSLQYLIRLLSSKSYCVPLTSGTSIM